MKKRILFVMSSFLFAMVLILTSCTRKIFTITFETNGGSTVESIQVPFNEIAIQPENPTKEGYSFIGWYLDSGLNYKYDFNSKVEGEFKLYAKWQVNKYVVSFETYGGNSIANKTFDYGSTIEISEVPSKVGYEFAGWYTEPSLNEEFTITTMPANDIKLYAAWDAIEYKVSFVSDGIEIEDLAQEVSYDTKATLPTEPVKEGYTFAGWYNGNDAYNFDSLVKGNLTLTAKWNINSYELTFDKNNGEEAEKVTYSYSSAISSIASPSKDGYVFTGWYDEEDKLFNFDNAYMPAKNITLKAKYEAGTYGIEYRRNSQNATGNMSIQSATYDQNVNILANAYTLNGYTFAGWNSKEDGTGTSYSVGQEVKNLVTSGNYILYAQWTANTYQVAFDANGGVGEMANLTVSYDETKGLTANAFTKTGYTFVGWAASNTGSVVYGNEDTVKNLVSEGSITLYAVWSANSYSVTFDANEGEGTIASQNRTYDDNKSLPNNAFTRVGYTFVNWNTKADGTGTSYDVNSTANLTSENGATITLYAQWNINSYNLTIYYNGESDKEQLSINYNSLIASTQRSEEIEALVNFDKWLTYPGNEEFSFDTYKMPASDFAVFATYKGQSIVSFNTNGGNNIAPIQGYEGDAITAPAVNPTKRGYNFAGWYADENLETEFDFATVTMPEGNLTIYAKWNPISYVVEFNSNGANGTMANQENRKYDDNVALPEVGFTKEGYSFIGWKNTDDESISNLFTGNLTSVDNSTVTLYAQWEANTYSVAFDKNNESATGMMNSLSAVVDKAQNLPTVAFLQEGYKVVEWNTKADGSGTAYALDANINVYAQQGQVVTLYAQWNPISYKIVYNDGELEIELASTSAEYGKDVTLTTVPTQEGYIFKGWSKTEGGVKVYDNGATVSNLTSVDGATVNLFALWEQIIYRVDLYSHSSELIGSIDVEYGKDLKASDYAQYKDAYTRVGYTFNGWTNSATSNDIVISGNEGQNTLSVNADMNLYANYTVNTYTVQFIIDNKVVYEVTQEYGTELKFDKYLQYLEGNVTLSKNVEVKVNDYYNVLFAYHSVGDYGEAFIGKVMEYCGYLQGEEVNSLIAISQKYYKENQIGVLVQQILGAASTYDIASLFGLTQQLYSSIETMASDFATERAVYRQNGENPYKDNSVFGGWVLGAETQYEQYGEGSPYLDKVPASTNIASNIARVKASWAELDPIQINHEKNSLVISWTAVDTSKYGDNCEVKYLIYHHTSTNNLLLDEVTENTYTFNTDPSKNPYYAPGTYQVYVVAVVDVKDTSGETIATLVSKETNQYTEVTVALQESNLQVDMEGDYYKKGTEDGVETFYFFTNMTYEFSDQNQFTFTDYDGNAIENDNVIVEILGEKNNVLKTTTVAGYFYFTNSKTPDKVYYAKVLPYTSQFDLGSNLTQFKTALSKENKNNLYLDDTAKSYKVGVNIPTNTTELVNNGFKFDLNVKTTGGKSIDYTQYKDYLVYKFEEYNVESATYVEIVTTDWKDQTKPWESSIGTYNYETSAWNFLSTNVGKKYRVTISINDNYVPPILSNKNYGTNGDKVGKGLIKGKEFVIELNEGINVFSNQDFKKAFADTSLKGGLNIHSDIVAELDSNQYYDGTLTSSNPLNNVVDGHYNSQEAANGLKGTPINVDPELILKNGGISGNVYERRSATDLNEDYSINGNYFKIDGTKLGYTNVYSRGDMSPLADYKIPDTKLTIIGYFVSSNAYDRQSTTNSKITINDLSIVSNAGNLGKDFDSGSQSAIDRLNLYSGGYHGVFVSNGSKAVINNLVCQNANIAVFINDGASLQANYLHTMASWYNSIFARNSFDIALDYSYLKDSGGAAIHFADAVSTMSNPSPATVSISSTTKIENFVSGEEAYFKVNSMEISVMQMKTQFNNTLGWFTGGSQDGMTPGSHKLIQSIIDPTTKLEYQKINFAFLFMPVDENQRGENGADATAYPHVNINADNASGINKVSGSIQVNHPQYGIVDVPVTMNCTSNVNYTGVKDMPILVGNSYNSTIDHYESTYIVIGSNIPGIGNCLFGSIGYYDGFGPK